MAGKLASIIGEIMTRVVVVVVDGADIIHLDTITNQIEPIN